MAPSSSALASVGVDAAALAQTARQQQHAGCAGLSAALVERVLERQVLEDAKERSAPALRRVVLCRKLPELARAMRSCLHEMNKRIMPQAELVHRLTLNGKWLASAAELREQMALLAELAPEWCTLPRVGEQPMVRINPTARFSEVSKVIDKAIEEAVQARCLALCT